MMYYSVYDIGKRISEEEFFEQRLSVAGWVHNQEFVNKVIDGDYSGIFPLHIELCSTYKCNFNCRWCNCRKSRLSQQNERQSLNFVDLCSIIDQCTKKSIGIQWTGGEPLINEATIDAIEYGTKQGINQCLFTNGSQLNTIYCKRLLESNLRFIRISLNCASEEYHSKFHGNIGVNLSRKTINNISVLCKTKQLLKSSVQIGISIVTDSNSIDDLQNTLLFIWERALEYPNTIDYIVIRSVNEDFDGIEYEKQPDFNKRYATIIKERDFDDYYRLGINVILPNELTDIHPRESKCLGCSVFSEVSPDGTLFLCSDKYGDKNYKIGNILESTFDIIWDSDELKNTRNQHEKCFSSGFCPSFSRGWYFNYIFSQIEEYRFNGKLDDVKRWITEIKKIFQLPAIVFLSREMMSISKCEICKRSKTEVSLMIQGQTGMCLCNECIRDYSNLLDEYSWAKNDCEKETFDLVRPHEMKILLDQVVVGHEKAKKSLSVALYNHQLFVAGKLRGKYKKNNILMVGPTGVGKTYLIENIAKIINVPLLICDATTYSEVGYVGDDVSHILELLYYQSGNDLKRAEKAIVFLDEIDKLASRDKVRSYGRDVSGIGVQQALLKMIEGKTVSFEATTERSIKQTISMDTTNILFIFSGAFVGMQEAGPISSALEKYGMLPEFIGRSYCFIRLENLNHEDLIKIMSQTDSSTCSIFKELFSIDGIDLEFDDAALFRIADICIDMGLGARGLFAIMNDLLFETRYEAIKNKVNKIVITESFVDSVLH